MVKQRQLLCMPLVLAAAVISACGKGERNAQPPVHTDEPAAVTNRIDIPAPVRRNLGITFVPVEGRRVEQTLRLPGRFELQPLARRAAHAMMPGRITLLVNELDAVEPGDVLFTVESPEWRELQGSLAEVSAEIGRLDAKLSTFGDLLAAHEQHHNRIEDEIGVWEERIAQLEAAREVGGGRAAEITAAQSSLAAARSALAEVLETEAQLQAEHAEARASIDAATAQRVFLLGAASSATGIPVETLTSASEDGPPMWAAIRTLEARAESTGIVESIGLVPGGWADTTTSIVTIIQPDMLRFRATALQSDLGALREGLTGRIVPATPTRAAGATDMLDAMTGAIRLSLAADPHDRTVDVLCTPDRIAGWARAGVSAELEIVTDSSADRVLAIPLAAVQRDGLQSVIFRRDPSNADKVIRLDADLGVDDGTWVEVRSGLALGDEVVLDGAYQLMLASSGAAQKGGHFHADGTFHEGDH